jgi:hypothetical protein
MRPNGPSAGCSAGIRSSMPAGMAGCHSRRGPHRSLGKPPLRHGLRKWKQRPSSLGGHPNPRNAC